MPYSLRKGPTLDLPKTHSFYSGTNAVHFRGSLMWNNLPAVVKSSNSLFEFKNKNCKKALLVKKSMYMLYILFYFVI